MQQRFRLKPVCLFVLQALALTARAADADLPAVAQIQVVEVFGSGQTRQVQQLTRSDLQKVIPGTSPLKSLEKLPGVSFQSADPFGAYEWSTRISIRGFNQSQLGFTLDGVPLGDMSYGNNNGLHISRAVSAENVGRVDVSQGAGALGTASTSNLGGTVQFFTLEPSENMGATFSQTVGSDSTSRTFARFDSGALPSGSKLFVSGTRQRADKWKGAGGQNQDQFNSMFMHSFGEHTLSAFFNYSNRDEVDYQDLSLDMVKRLGYNWDNYAPDWQRALDAAKTPPVFSGGVNSQDDAYYLGRGLRKDSLAGVSLDLKLATSTDLKATAYHHSNDGQGHWYTPYKASSPTIPISIRTTEYAIARDGVIADLNWEMGKQTVSAGYWGERSLHTASRNFYAVNGPEDDGHFLSNPFATAFDQKFTTTTNQFYVQDALSLSDQLKFSAGFKSPKVTIEAISLVPDTRAGGTLTASKAFLPQAGLNYTVNRNIELFTSASQNMRAFQPGVNGPFSQSQAGFDASAANIKPETSTTVDLGLRFKQDALQGSVALYHADFKDRLLNVSPCQNIVGCPNQFVNVGKVQTDGLEAIAVWKMVRELSWFNSFTYNNSQYKSDYRDGDAIVAVSGKDVVDAPRTMFSTELAYESGAWSARFADKYTAKRYYTYTNDGQVPSYWLATLSAGYKMKSLGMFKEVSLQLNVNNLFDKKYLGTIGSNGFVASDPNGTVATMLAGSPRQFFLTLCGKI